jgi:hypothetical protein
MRRSGGLHNKPAQEEVRGGCAVEGGHVHGVSISKHSGLPWDAVAAEMAELFKPGPAIYHTATQYLGIASSEIMMVVSHNIRHLCL